MGKVAMRMQVETWARSEKRPDCDRARMPVPKAMEDEMRCAEVLEEGSACLLLLLSCCCVVGEAPLVRDVMFG